jgi:hypothetical protein
VMRLFLHRLAPWQRGTVAALVNACAWTLVYFLFLRTPLPAGWTVRSAEFACLAAGVMGGALGCLTSRRLWPVALGAATGIIFGGAEAVVSDVSMSYWQRVTSGLVIAPLPLYLWLSIVTSWLGVSLALGRWQFPLARMARP